MAHALTRCALAGLCSCAACDPFIATVGYENGASTEERDAGQVAMRDAGMLDAPDAQMAGDTGTLARDAHAGDGGNDCVVLPALRVGDAGVEMLQAGVVTGSTDEALACTMPAADVVTYQRTDGVPILVAGTSYSLSWPAGPGATGQVFLANAGCEQSLLPLTYLVAVPTLPGCANLNITQTGTFLRALLGAPTTYPDGLTLCPVPCARR